MIILGIETSCDETAVALVKNGRTILSNVVRSQEHVHRPYGGVVPELASRFHLSQINALTDTALTRAHASWNTISAIAVTRGPGLAGSLLVGNMTARAYAFVHKKPLIGIQHLEGHICASLLLPHPPRPPFLSLVVSGGHTTLIHVKNWGDYTIVGKTLDDAAGEAFDKVAKYVGFGYPGGPIIDRISQTYNGDMVDFPLPYPQTNNFSFSGIKTAVVNYWKSDNKMKADAVVTGFQDAVVRVIVKKTVRAACMLGIKKIVIGGGVAANSLLRARMAQAGKKEKMSVFLPPKILCTDNGAMIAAAGYIHMKHDASCSRRFSVKATLPLERWLEGEEQLAINI